ncbi:MAG: PD-(D/E)XK nuclease family protein, partial [Phycisphaeraceae bacterium]
DDVTVVAADGDLSEPIRAGLSLAGVRAAIVGSRGLAASGPAVLLGQLARFVETRGVDDLAVLVRHPDLDGYLRGVVGGDGDWAGLLDGYAEEAFHRRLGSVWVGDDEVIVRVKSLYEAVMGLVSVEAGEERRLEGWVEVLRGVLRAVYGAREVEARSVLAEEVEGLLDELDAVASLGQLAEGVPEVGFGEAVDWVLGGAEGAAVGLAGDEAAVPIVGVLEMAFDGAGVLVVAGLNEGSFPARPGVEPLLPMSVRKRLGLDAGEMREARDRWALEVAVRCRREVTLIAAGRSVNREPLLPSLVLLGGDRETRVVRLRRFLEGREHPAERLRLGEPGRAHRFLMIPPGREGVVLRRLGVTAFRDYLLCPYRFYLKYVERLTAVEEEGGELGAARFGTLTHDVLKWLAEVDAKERGSLLRVERLLEGALEAEAAKRFGDDRSVAQRIQLESLRARLAAVARVQVSRWAAGWEIVAAERKLELPLEVNEEAVVVSGRIDRIDRHPELGWQVLDYKTFGKITRKNEARGRHHTRDLVWSDLQLPLYLDLVRHSMVGVDEAVDAGYWILPGASSADVGGHVHLAGWNGEELASARAVRDEVLRRIVGGLFWPPGDLPVFEDGLAGLCGDGAADRAGLIARTTALMGGGA